MIKIGLTLVPAGIAVFRVVDVIARIVGLTIIIVILIVFSSGVVVQQGFVLLQQNIQCMCNAGHDRLGGVNLF